MALKFSEECQLAIDSAKKAVNPDGVLGACLVLDALSQSPSLKLKYAALEEYFTAPKEINAQVPPKVSLHPELRPVFNMLAERGHSIEPDELFAALIESPAGSKALEQRGVPHAIMDDLLNAGSSARNKWRTSHDRKTAIQALNPFGRMLTESELPAGGVAQREETITALVRTLSKMKRRNAIVVGPPGTGKSAIVYELARRIYGNDQSIPERIRESDIFELSPVFLRSGASVVGQYEERIKNLLEVLTKNPQIIVFIDEIHSMFQSGVHQRGPFSDANESFKGALGRGEITCIGCTTPGEYRNLIKPDKALERRFGIIRLEPPTSQMTLEILKSRRDRMEIYFTPLKIPNGALEKTIALSEEYLPGRYQPDKSIQLLDNACAGCATAKPPILEVTEAALVDALEDTLGYRVVRKEILREDKVYSDLREKIVGQDRVLQQIARAFVSSLGGWSRSSGPRGVFLFGGPTGVGKTETAVELSKILGNGRDALIRVDCNTLQGTGTDSGPETNRLLGVPPGFVGYARGQGGLLSRVRDQPESLILFDEFEKASPSVGQLILQMIDNGQVEDTDGNLLDFRRSFFVFTTNAGCIYESHQLGFSNEPAPTSTIPRSDLEALKNQLRSIGHGEEFLARMTHVLLFEGLETQSIRIILERQLDRLRKLSEVKGLKLTWDPSLVDHLASKWQPRWGVRFLTTILRNRLIEQIGIADVQGDLNGATSIHVSVLKASPQNAAIEAPGVADYERDGDSLIIRIA